MKWMERERNTSHRNKYKFSFALRYRADLWKQLCDMKTPVPKLLVVRDRQHAKLCLPAVTNQWNKRDNLVLLKNRSKLQEIYVINQALVDQLLFLNAMNQLIINIPSYVSSWRYLPSCSQDVLLMWVTVNTAHAHWVSSRETKQHMIAIVLFQDEYSECILGTLTALFSPLTGESGGGGAHSQIPTLQFAVIPTWCRKVGKV